MALNYDLRKIKGLDELHKDKTEQAITEALIWLTMMVGFGEITEKNWKEFFARCEFLEKLDGPILSEDNGKKVPLKPEDVQRRIGLVTNVSRETDAKWASRIFRGNRDRTVVALRRAEERKQAEAKPREELCSCGALKSEHQPRKHLKGRVSVPGHGPCPKTGCKQFTWASFVEGKAS